MSQFVQIHGNNPLKWPKQMMTCSPLKGSIFSVKYENYFRHQSF